VEWNLLFVRGFVEFAEVRAQNDIGELLTRMFAAAPLVRLVVSNLDEPRLLALLDCPFLGRLIALAMPDLRTNFLSTSAGAKLAEATHRFKTTSFIFNRE
jgi:hypothetical protein